MHIFKVKYFIFGEPVVAIVRADDERESLQILKDRCDEEDNFTLRDVIVRYEDDVKGVLLSVFQ